MNLVLETDIGGDPDDFAAICYLAAAAVKIRAVTIVPGARDQVALVRFIARNLGLDFPIGSACPGREAMPISRVHAEILNRYGAPDSADPDGSGAQIIAEVLRRYPACQLFACGPLENVAAFLRWNPGPAFPRATMQGGFVGCDVHDHDVVRLPEFEGAKTYKSFNLNQDVDSAHVFLNHPGLSRRFVGKTVCHTIRYDRDIQEKAARFPARHPATQLMREFMELYLERRPYKKFHDPTAAVCHLHPVIATWITGRLYHDAHGWGTEPAGQGDEMCVDVDREALWKHIFEGS